MHKVEAVRTLSRSGEDSVQVCRDGVRKGETHTLLNLLKDVKGNKNGFYMHIRSKKKTREDAGPLLNGKEHQVTRGMEKTKGLMPSSLPS